MIEFTANTIALLMQQHRNELLRFLAQRVSCPDMAQDIFQETFIRFQGYEEKNAVENPRAFLFRIASNLATDYLRSPIRQSNKAFDSETILAELENPALSPEAQAISQQELDLLISALQELPPKCRDVFIMLRFKNYSYAQVEAELGISNTMILKYLNRALSHCRARLTTE